MEEGGARCAARSSYSEDGHHTPKDVVISAGRRSGRRLGLLDGVNATAATEEEMKNEDEDEEGKKKTIKNLQKK